jgi:tetratricopeptide (TPR) repeat protein
MAKVRSPKDFWLRLDKFLGVILILSVFCLIFALSHRAIFDADIWLHLKTGELIVKNKIIPSKDIFSFTLDGKPWIDHEWLFQAVSYLIYNKWQAEGLILLESYCLIAAFFILFLMGTYAIKSYMEVAIFILMTAYACVSRFNIRPDIFSLLFFSLYLYLLRFHINKKIIWLLLPIQVLWVNFHGYFFLGPLVAFLFILAEFLRRKIRFLPQGWKEEFILDDIAYKRLLKVFFFILLMCLVNPQGLHGAFYPLDIFKGILTGKTEIFFKYIQELQPTFKMKAFAGNVYFLITIFCFSLMALNLKNLKLVEAFLALTFFLFALRVRNVAFFAFIAFMIIISYMGSTLNRISQAIKLEIPVRKTLYFLLKYNLIIFLMVWTGVKINELALEGYYDFESKKFNSLIFGIDERRYPKGAVSFLLKNNINAPLFNDFNSGAYLIGTGYPMIKIFIDGRTELYGPEFFNAYKDMIQGNPEVFEKAVNKYDISAVLLSLSTQRLPEIINNLYKSPQWKLVFFDAQGLVFLRDTPQNQDLIKEHGIELKNYKTPIADLQNLGLRRAYPGSYIKRASLFNLLKEETLVIEEAKEALRIMPNCSEAFHLMGKVYLRKGLYQESLENLRATLLLTPRNVEALVNLGTCLKELKDYKSAIQVLKGAIRFKKSYAPAYYELGTIYLSLGKESKPDIYMVKAKKELMKASKLNKGVDPDLEKNILRSLEEIKIAFPSVK